MTVEEALEKLNKSKVPIFVIDKNLERFKGQDLFPKKLRRANQILAKTGLPKLTY